MIAGHRVDGLVIDPAKGGLAPSILEGHRPEGAGEIVLGTKTMRDLGVGIGDHVEVATLADATLHASMEVVGRAVFPVFADAGQLGRGLYVDRAGGARIAHDATISSASVLVRLEPGASLTAVTSSLQAQMGPVADIEQGRPTDIVDFGQVRRTPDLLVALLAAISAVALGQILITAPRRRRNDLAVLRALGFERRQVRAAVTWQAVTTVAIALTIGVPIGILAGLSIWRRFAANLGGHPGQPAATVGLRCQGRGLGCWSPCCSPSCRPRPRPWAQWTVALRLRVSGRVVLPTHPRWREAGFRPEGRPSMMSLVRLVTLRDLQWRRRRFATAVAAALCALRCPC